MSVRVSPIDWIQGEIDALFDGQRDISEVIEDVARLGARLIIQTAVEAEAEVFLGRARYQRRCDAPAARAGSRNGYQDVTIKTTAGDGAVAEAARHHRGVRLAAVRQDGDPSPTRWRRW